MHEAAFNFHDRYGIRVRSENPDVIDFYEAEYQAVRGSLAQGSKTVTLTWRNKRPRGEEAQRYFFHTHKLLARWFYSIGIQPDEVTLEVVGNRFAIPMVHHMLVHPSLRYLCALDGTLLLHGAAIVQHGRSIVITGPGGVGKTTVSSILLQAGGAPWSLHADDYVFLLPDHRSMAYPTRSHLYLPLLRWVPQLKQRLKLGERIQVEFFGRLRSLSKDNIKWPVRLSAERLWPSRRVAGQAEVAAIILLKPSQTSEASLIEAENHTQVVEELWEMNFHEARHFLALVSKGAGLQRNEHLITSWKEKERHLLSDRLAETRVFWLELPRYDGRPEKFAEKLIHLLEPLVQTGPEAVTHA